MNQNQPEPAHTPEPAPSPGPDVRPRKSRHGRVPKDQRGDRNKRKVGEAIRSLVNWGAR